MAGIIKERLITSVKKQDQSPGEELPWGLVGKLAGKKITRKTRDRAVGKKGVVTKGNRARPATRQEGAKQRVGKSWRERLALLHQGETGTGS